MNAVTNTLGSDGLRQFLALQVDAVSAVTKRIYAAQGPQFRQYGPGGEAACREDLTLHLEFLRPVLEFGFQAPMTDYLCWQASVLASRGIASDQLEAPLNWLAQYFVRRMETKYSSRLAISYVDKRGGLTSWLGSAAKSSSC